MEAAREDSEEAAAAGTGTGEEPGGTERGAGGEAHGPSERGAGGKSGARQAVEGCCMRGEGDARGRRLVVGLDLLSLQTTGYAQNKQK